MVHAREAMMVKLYGICESLMEWRWNVIRAWALEHSFSKHLWIPCLESPRTVVYSSSSSSSSFLSVTLLTECCFSPHLYRGLIDWLEKISKAWLDVGLLRLWQFVSLVPALGIRYQLSYLGSQHRCPTCRYSSHPRFITLQHTNTIFNLFLHSLHSSTRSLSTINDLPFSPEQALASKLYNNSPSSTFSTSTSRFRITQRHVNTMRLSLSSLLCLVLGTSTFVSAIPISGILNHTPGYACSEVWLL